MPYNIASLKSITDLNPNVEIDVFSWGEEKKLTPFRPPKIKRVKFYCESEFNFCDLKEHFLKQRFQIVYICNRREKKYLKLAALAKKMNILVIGQSDEQFYNTFRQYIKKVFSRWIYLRYFDYIMVPGYYQYEMMRYLGFLRNQILIGAYTADIKVFNKHYLSFPHVVKQDLFKFLFVGRLEPEKGLDLLLRALERLQPEYKFELIVIGNGSMLELVKSFEFVTHISFTSQKEICKVLQDVQFFVLPSKFEPWGVVIHEMAAAGIPIVCSDACGARAAFVFNNYNGFVFETDSLISCTNALSLALKLNDERKSLFKKRSFELSQCIKPDTWAECINQFLN